MHRLPKTILPPLLATIIVLFVAAPAFTQTVDSSAVRAIIKKVDQLYRSKSSSSSMEMEIITPHWQRTLALDAWTEGMDKTFFRITSPKKEQGVATLRVENEMWNYLPKTNKVMKVPPSMMMSNDDLVKEFSLFEDYSYELIEVDGGADSLYYIKAIPREDLPVVWGHIIIAVRKQDYLPFWQKYYDEKGELMRTWAFSDIKTFGNRTIPSVMEIVPENKEGHKTIVRYLTVEFDTEIDENIFSLRNLRADK